MPDFSSWPLVSMTPQQVFDTVATHLLTQMQRSKEEDPTSSMCLYRGPNNLQCAAGVLIPDTCYSPCMEKKTWNTLVGMKAVPPHHYQMIRELQNIHDNNPPCNWAVELRVYANLNNLTMPTI